MNDNLNETIFQNALDKDACYYAKGLVILVYFGWSCSILQIRNNITQVGSKSQLLTCTAVI